jgi:hypothetical protein
MINLRCVSQPQFPEGFVEGAVGDLWEPWMREADQLLDDDHLLNVVYEASGEARSQEPDIWTPGSTRRDCSADAVAQAHTQLEFR